MRGLVVLSAVTVALIAGAVFLDRLLDAPRVRPDAPAVSVLDFADGAPERTRNITEQVERVQRVHAKNSDGTYKEIVQELAATRPPEPARLVLPPSEPHAVLLGRCSGNCSGHDAGYAWAREHDIDDPYACDGNSRSFIEGCEEFAEERQDELTAEGGL